MNREAREKQHLIETLYIRDKKREEKYCSRKGKEKKRERFFFDEDKNDDDQEEEEKNKQTNNRWSGTELRIDFNISFLASKRVEFHSFPHPETTILSINNRQNATHNSNTIHTDTTLNKDLR